MKMLRITESQESSRALRLRLDGTITNDSFRDLKNIVAQHQGPSGSTVILDMTGVDFITDEPARQLAKLSGRSFRIINCSPFIMTLLETLNGEDTGQ